MTDHPLSNMVSFCAICGNPAEKVWDLPNLPLTDTFVDVGDDVKIPFDGFDQAFLYCDDCRHGQLAFEVSPDILYGGNYCFRTSASPTARKGTDFFFSVLNDVAPDRIFDCAVDLGCNDLFLIEQLKGRAHHRVGVDPIWEGREGECSGEGLQVIGAGVEDAKLDQLEKAPDLIVCRHTLEHLPRPLDTIRQLLDVAAKDAVFIFEVPGLEALVKRHRFDQVFHQHLQYFSQESFLKMLMVAGGKAIALKANYHDWGAFAVAFVRADSASTAEDVVALEAAPRLTDVKANIDLFLSHMAQTRKTIDDMEGPLFGYGAAQMLPILAYHLKTDLSFLDAVIDDDPDKDGVRYWNLPVEIRPSKVVRGLQQASVLITAVDSALPIMRRLFEDRPKHIIYPFNII